MAERSHRVANEITCLGVTSEISLVSEVSRTSPALRTSDLRYSVVFARFTFLPVHSRMKCEQMTPIITLIKWQAACIMNALSRDVRLGVVWRETKCFSKVNIA
jgi:hypothetical protein